MNDNKFNKMMINRSYTEIFDYKECEIILKNKEEIKKLLRPESFYDHDPFKILEIYLNKKYHINNEIYGRKIKYKYSKFDTNETGRKFANCGYQNMCRTFRHTLARKYYYDIDIVNCHPVILQYLCDRHNIACPKLTKYITDRDEYLNTIADNFDNVNTNDVKKCILEFLNDGSSTYKRLNIKSDFMILLKNEIDNVINDILEINEYDFIFKNRKKSNNTHTEKGSKINIIYCYIESKLLNLICKFLTYKYGDSVLDNSVLCFDGIMISKKYHIDDQLLNECIKFVKKKMSVEFFDIKLKVMNDHIDLSKLKKSYLHISSDVNEITFYDYKKFSGSLFSAVESEIIIWFNETCKYIISGGCVSIYTKEYDICDSNPFKKISKMNIKYKPTNVKKVFDCIKKCKLISGYDDNGTPVYINLDKIITTLIEEDRINTYRNINFFPYSNSNDNNYNQMNSIYNTFHGFYFDDYELKYNTPFIFEHSVVYNHILNVICNNDKILFDYFINYIAHLIQKPYDIPEVALFLYSQRHGVGKNMIAEKFISRLINDEHFILYKNGEGFFNKFNVSQMNRLVVLFDELKDGNNEFIKNRNFLKSKITSNKKQIEPKGMESFSINSYDRYLFLSNNKHSIYIEPSDRRFVVFDCDNVIFKKFNKEEKRFYFNNILNLINNDDFIKNSFEFFKNKNIKNFHPRDIVTTKLKIDMCLYNLNNIKNFVIQYIKESADLCIITDDEKKIFRVSSKLLWSEYKKWCSDSNETCYKLKTFNETLLTLNIKKIKYRVREPDLRNKTFYTATLDEINDYFKEIFYTDNYNVLD